MNPHPPEKNRTTSEFVRVAAAAISAKKGADIIAYDVSAVSSITDFYLVCSGLNTAHLKALFNETRLALKDRGANCWRQSGHRESGWIVADYIDFVIHFFKKDARAYYQIDQLWQSTPKLDLNL